MTVEVQTRELQEPDTLQWVVRLGGWVPVAFLVVCFLYAVAVSWHWPLMLDAAAMHYVVVLMQHGFAPYRDVIDFNMPGAYMTDWLVMHVFGPGDLAWRLFDVATMLVTIGSCYVIAKPFDGRAGLVSGLAISVLHASHGAGETGERDWVMMTLMLLGYALLFTALRRQRPLWMAAFGAVFGAAASIKPLMIPIPFVLLLLACWKLRRRSEKIAAYVRYAFLGAAFPLAGVILFLLRYHCTEAMIQISKGLLPYYTQVNNMPYPEMARLAAGGHPAIALGFVAVVMVLLKTWRNWELQCLLLGAGFGTWFYFAQHKGWEYHRATMQAFLILWLVLHAYLALRRQRFAMLSGFAVLAGLLFYATAKWLPDLRKTTQPQIMEADLQQDLFRLHAANTTGSVQCLEMVNGCLTTLYRMHIVQPTGFISDFFLFVPNAPPVVQQMRSRLLDEMAHKPPRVIVLTTSRWGTDEAVYPELQNWPALATMLNTQYVLDKERPGHGNGVSDAGYRLYVRRQ